MAKDKKAKIDREAPTSVRFVQDLVDEAVDVILKGIQHLQDGNMKEFEKLKKGQEENNRQTKQLRNDIDQLRKGQKDIVETLEDITLNHTTREEFYSLKKKVFRHHPTPIK